MKHCPNPDCPHAKSTGGLPEYEDDVVECGDCRTQLVDGPAPVVVDDSVPLERVASFSLPHEAHIACAALASHGIAAVVDHDHTPYPSAGSWVHLHVAQSDVGLARIVLEEGPVVETAVSQEIDSPTAVSGPDLALDDDMRPMRLSRRISLARWFLYGQAVSGLVAVPLTLAVPLLGLTVGLMAVGALGLALWSHRNPRSAFGVAVVFELLLVTVTVAFEGPAGGLGIVAVLAVYFAWAAAGEHPPELLQAKPAKTRSVEAQIGDAWKGPGPSRV